MIKRVQANEVRLGMYIHEIRGNWMEHPFWRKSFKLAQQKDLDKLVSSNLEAIWIDTNKGLDVVKANPVKILDGVDSDKPQSIKKPVARVLVEEELHVAKKIQNKAKEAVAAMFADVRMGKALEIEEAELLVNEINQSMERIVSKMTD